MSRYTLALLSLVSLLGSASSQSSTGPASDLARPYANFGFDVLRDLSAGRVDNVFISPYSIAVSLAMISNGANGPTRAAILKTIHSEGRSSDALNASNRALIDDINKSGAVQLSTANALWIQQSATVSPKFAQTLQGSYVADAQSVDFGLPQTKDTINSWVAKHTNGRIPQIIGDTSPSLIVLLTDAIAFKGKWTLPFKTSLTKPHDFKAISGIRKVPMMLNSDEYAYANNNAAESICLPYADRTFAMYIVLPHAANDLNSFVQGLTAQKFSATVAELRRRRGTIELPRFSLTYKATLNSTLEKLGMGIAFASSADFSGIAQRQLRISDVQHASFLKVDEEGTEAAAATAIAMPTMAMKTPPIPPFHMVVDHPFLLAIRDERNGQILFMGIVAEPKE